MTTPSFHMMPIFRGWLFEIWRDEFHGIGVRAGSMSHG